MEDVITEIPPPSRFLLEDLNIFTPPSPPLPLPILLFSTPTTKKPICPSLLIIALSSSSIHLFHHLSAKSLIGTLVLPEVSFSGNSIGTSFRDKSCNIYALNNNTTTDGLDQSTTIVIVSVQYPITPERSHAVAKLLIGEQIQPERVLILDSIQSRNFRGKLSRDEMFACKLETSSETSRDSPLLKGVDYFPSGSMVDGLGAALLAKCQMRNIEGTLLVSWPETGLAAKSLVKSILQKIFLPDAYFTNTGKEEDVLHNRDLGSEIYT